MTEPAGEGPSDDGIAEDGPQVDQPRPDVTGVDPLWGFASPGESRWAVSAAVLAALALQIRLPPRLLIGPRWLIPGIEGLILVTVLIANPSRLDRESRDVRKVSLALIVILGGTNLVALGLLVRNLLNDGNALQGHSLILAAVSIWITGVISFGMLYWELDRGGPIRRCSADHDPPDLLFTQMSNAGVGREPWSPTFVDYLYLSFTNSSAFSPTDTLPLTTRVKMLMTVQGLMALITIAIVGARAVNILT